MPLPDGNLTEEEFNLVSLRLHQLWQGNGGKKPCPQCGNHHYYIHPALLGNRSDTLSPMQAHTRMPTVLVYCRECGYADHYIARQLGIEVLLPEGAKR